VKALASEVPPARVALSEPLLSIDLKNRVARTNARELRYERLVSSAPFPKLAAMTGLAHDATAFTWNKVLVFNLGFDKKGPSGAHWIYYPARDRVFYRVGFYDNIFDTDRLSAYVEIGYPKDGAVDAAVMLPRVLADLEREGVIGKAHELVSHHSVVMDPAYVHITQASTEAHKRLSRELAGRGVHSIGRYGGWTYCSIEDNIVEARALVQSFG
jgi:protoporphyrinogen oxidase